jgi:hypothetical protein
MEQFEKQTNLQNNLQNPTLSPNEPKSGKKKLILFVLVGLLVFGVVVVLSLSGGENFKGMYFRTSRISTPVEEPISAEAQVKDKVFSAEPTVKVPKTKKVYSAEPQAVLTAEPMADMGESASSLEECFPEEEGIAQKEAITRVQFAKILAEAGEFEAGAIGEPIYKDVSTANPCYKYVQALGEKNIPNKYFGNIVKPNLPLKRKNLVAWVVKAFDIPFVSVQGSSFPDVPTNASYSIYLEALNSWNAVLLPRGENRFFPDEDAQYGWAKAVVSVAKFMKAFSLIS